MSFHCTSPPCPRWHRHKEPKLLLSRVNAPSTSPWKSGFSIRTRASNCCRLACKSSSNPHGMKKRWKPAENPQFSLCKCVLLHIWGSLGRAGCDTGGGIREATRDFPFQRVSCSLRNASWQLLMCWRGILQCAISKGVSVDAGWHMVSQISQWQVACYQSNRVAGKKTFC